MSGAMRSVNWRLHLPLALLLAAVVHLATIWAYPRVVMRAVLQGLVAMGTAPQPVYPAPTDHTQRRIVMPSPDLLYALCAYDLTAGPLTVTADPPVPGYWSVALYADNTDNFFVVHDRQAGRRPLRLMLLAPGAVPPAAGADGAEVVTAPAARGLLLMRLLADPTLPLPLLDAARRTLRCDQPAASR